MPDVEGNDGARVSHWLDTRMPSEKGDLDDFIKGPSLGMRGLGHASLEDVTVIDIDEFEAARRDPKVREFLADAEAEGARVEAEGRKVWLDSSDATGL